MTSPEYRSLGYALPACRVKVWPIPGAGWMVELRANGLRARFDLDLPPAFTKADVLHRLLYVEANEATRFLRDVIADWPDQTHRGRLEAVAAWRRLRRRRLILKRLFPEDCP